MNGPSAGKTPVGVSPAEPGGSVESLPAVRKTVRDILLATPAYRELDPARRKQLAQAMVQVCQTAATWIHEELVSDAVAQGILNDGSASRKRDAPRTQLPSRQTLAMAQSAGSDFSGVAAARVAGTTQAILNAVSFPRFVTDLINGVFKAMLDSNAQQLNQYVDLLNNVAASLDGFADTNLGPDNARAWLADKFPASFEVSGERPEPGEDDDGQGGTRLQLRDGASMPPEAALRTSLGLAENESVPTGDPDRTLVPLARRALAQTRQQMLATMVMLGMQRIVIESGRITAAMRFHIDTRSAAQADQGSTFDWKNELNVKGHYDVGIWGVHADMKNTIGYVSTQKSQTTEEMNTDLDLNSSVEINFKSDYLPLNRLASPGQAQRIRENSRNPEAEAAEAARAARAERAGRSDDARRASLDRILTPAQPASPQTAQPSPQGQPGSQGKGGQPAQAQPQGQTNPQGQGGRPTQASPQGRTNPQGQGGQPTQAPPQGQTNPPGQQAFTGS